MKKTWLTLLGFLVVVIGSRILMLYCWPFPMTTGDEALEILMAKKIAQNVQFYAGWPGQNYMGSFGFYWLAFWGQILGWQVESARLATLFLIFIQLLTLALVAYRCYGINAALLTIAIFSWQTAYVNCQQLQYPSYQTMLAIAALAILVKTWIPTSQRHRSIKWLLVGWLGGLAIWANELALLLLPPLLISIEPRRWINWRSLPWLASGLLIGYLPRLIYILLIKDAGIDRLIWMALGAKETPGVQSSPTLLVSQLSTFSDKLTYRWHAIVQIYGYPLLIIFTVACLLFLIQAWRQRKPLVPSWLSKGIVLTLVIFLIEGNHHRYLVACLPYFILLTGSLISACSLPSWLNQRRLAAILVGGGILFSWFSAAAAYSPAASQPLKQLVATIRTNRYTSGISGYDTALLLMIELDSQTHPLSVSVLGGPLFRTRLLEKEIMVSSNGAQFVVYLITDPAELKTALTNYLTAAKIQWQHENIANTYELYHHFSHPIYPGSYLPTNTLWQKQYLRFAPTNPQRLQQDAANQLRWQ